jgi:hypothetical protein
LHRHGNCHAPILRHQQDQQPRRIGIVKTPSSTPALCQ